MTKTSWQGQRPLPGIPKRTSAGRASSSLLYADLAFRVRRAEELAEYGSMDVQKFVEKVDAQRDTYCRYYTKHALDDLTLLDVCLNAARLPMEENARVLAEMIRSAAAKT